MAEPWPDLSGECPDDWEFPERWLAAQAIHQGATLREVADRLDVSAGTVGRWKRQWKDRYGDSFLAGDKTRGLAEAREIASAYRSGTRWAAWADVRAAAASANGVTADLAREIAQKVLLDHLEDPAKMAALTVDDALTLVKVADMLEKRADELLGLRRGSASGGLGAPVDMPGAEEVPAGILDGLDAPVGEEASAVLQMAAENAQTFLHLVDTTGLPADGVIEVEGSRTA